jgi:hypothetical protein
VIAKSGSGKDETRLIDAISYDRRDDGFRVLTCLDNKRLDLDEDGLTGFAS